jgi:hypothetical protein
MEGIVVFKAWWRYRMATCGYSQTFTNSCGAVSLMVATAELKNHGQAWCTKVRETAIYSQVSRPQLSGYSWPGLIYQECGRRGLTAVMCEDRTIVSRYKPNDRLSPFFKNYWDHKQLIPSGVRVHTAALDASAFSGGKRVLLVVINAAGGLHYLLGRDERGLTVMDPGSGANTRCTVAQLKNPAFRLGRQPYRFTGISIQLS